MLSAAQAAQKREVACKLSPLQALRRTGGSETFDLDFTRNFVALRRTGGSEKSDRVTGESWYALRRTGGSEKLLHPVG